MDPPRKRGFPGFLARAETGKSSDNGLSRVGTDQSVLDIGDEEAQVLGLTTLYEPVTPAVVDIIFIHGLGGGSRKTWSFSKEPGHYWPKEWLPVDQELEKDVRVHTFGYNANWGERRQSVLNIYAFAQSLLSDLKNNPILRRTKTKIILVGHSMGGCVAKKTYILARQDPTCAELAARIHSIFFLGTPHRGSDLAATLENILTVAWGKKLFVTDLTPNSAALAEINDSFRHVAPELRLWSFYETLPMKSKIMNKLVVDQASATLGYANEEIASMSADHRHVCKFESRADPNYRMLRNALVTAVDLVRAADAGESSDSQDSAGEPGAAPLVPSEPLSREVTSRLRAFLDVADSLDDEYLQLQLFKEPGSCQWFTHGDAFTQWKSRTGPSILWLLGPPAAGKSVISSHVVDEMEPPHSRCSYFFFRHGELGKSTLGDCFHALTFQMAMQDEFVKQQLLQLEDEKTVWDKSDEASVWRKLMSGILKTPSIGQHVWVIDGLDECANFNALFTKKLLSSLPNGIRLFVTSRGLDEIGRGLTTLGPKITTQTLSNADTLEDMRLFVSAKLAEFDRFDSDEAREVMCEKILEKSTGSFLWLRLVLQEFEDAWSEEMMYKILKAAPPGLDELYSRMADSIESDARKLRPARCILTWVILSARPLSVDELRCAVKLHLNETLQNTSKAIPSLCQQLVYIDQSDKVQLIHETAREFMLSRDEYAEISIQPSRDHTEIARCLLRYLISGVFKTQQQAKPARDLRSRGFGSVAPNANPPDTSLVDYASTSFSEHLHLGTSQDDELAEDLVNLFGSSHILSWIEHLAQRSNLSAIIRTAMNLRQYLKRRVKYLAPTASSFQLLDGWIVDLIRMTTKFSRSLRTCPSSIHWLIPPLCPPGSLLSRTFCKNTRFSVLDVVGLPPGGWDDCLVRVDFQKGQTTAVVHGDQFFAVGRSTGHISVFDGSSHETLRVMMHPERVKLLELSHYDIYLVSCGSKHVVVWDPKSGVQCAAYNLDSPALAVTFLGSGVEVLCATQGNLLVKWDLEMEDEVSVLWKEGNGLGGNDDVPDYPSRAAFLDTAEGTLMALGYRRHPIYLWHALDVRLLGLLELEENNGLNDMVFNPNEDIPALVVATGDGRLCLFDYSSMVLSFVKPQVNAQTLSCSRDGRSLVTGSNAGIIEVFEFDEDSSGSLVLKPIYRVNSFDESSSRGLAFSSDGLRFVDVRGKQCRVWGPAALVRKDNELESTSSEHTLPLKIAGAADESEEPDVTSVPVPTSDGMYLVAGKQDGSVVLFSAATGKEIGVLYQHARDASINSVLVLGKDNLIVSNDDANRVLAARLVSPTVDQDLPSRRASDQNATLSETVLDRHFDAAIVQLLGNAAADRLLISGHDVHELWDMSSGATLGSWSPAVSQEQESAKDQPAALAAAHRSHSAFQHPVNAAEFVIVHGDAAHVFSWADFAERTPVGGAKLNRPTAANTQMSQYVADKSASARAVTVSYHVGPGFVVEYIHAVSPYVTPRLYVWPAAAFMPQPDAGPAFPASEPNLDAIGPAVHSVLGVLGVSTLVFLDPDLWVCTVELQSTAPKSTTSPFKTRPSLTNDGAPGPPSTLTRSAASPLASNSRPGGVALPTRSATAQLAQRAGQTRPALAGNEPQPQAHRHFFGLNEWRVDGALRCAMMLPAGPASARGGSGPSFAFVNRQALVLIKGGLQFAEGVALAGTPGAASQKPLGAAPTTGAETDVASAARPGTSPWRSVSGGTQRRASYF